MKLPAIVLTFAWVLNSAAQPALQLIRTIPLPGVAGRIDHMAVDIPGHRLFVAALGNDTVEVLDTETGRRLQTIGNCHEPQGLAFLPATGRLFVANGGSDELEIYEGGKFQRLKTIGSLADADNVRFDAISNRVYVGYGSGALGVFDPNGIPAANILLTGHPESFQIEQNGNRIFVNIPGDRAVAVIDRTKPAVVAKWRLEAANSNFPMVFDETDRRLFVSCRSPAKLLVLDTTSGRTVAQLEISGDADDVFYDAKRRRLYLSGGEGFLDVIQGSPGDHYERIAQLPTRRGARTCLFTPDTDRLYLAVPKSGSHAAEIRIYQPN